MDETHHSQKKSRSKKKLLNLVNANAGNDKDLHSKSLTDKKKLQKAKSLLKPILSNS